MTYETPNYTIIMQSANKAYFEHKRLGEDQAGGLWFDDSRTLIDYDGVYEVPKSVVAKLTEQGFNMDYATITE